MSELDDWATAVAMELGLTATIDRSLVLDLARDVAHGVARPAAPLTTYLVGVAVGAGADPRDAARRIADLAAGWNPDREPSPTTLED
jgi:hypothetical protein